jgi:hypothetical protein
MGIVKIDERLRDDTQHLSGGSCRFQFLYSASEFGIKINPMKFWIVVVLLDIAFYHVKN